MLNKRAFFSSAFFTVFGLALFLLGCANRQLPQGGPRDRDPPKLMKATPPNETRYFKDKVIQLDFDEYIKLVNQYAEVVMSPAPAKSPEYKVKRKSLVITLKDSLEKNTTYVINFGKGIQDVNESNILKNFTYVFSTGPHIDSLSITGHVTNIITQQKEKDATVMLFSLKQDSLLFGKKKPTIFTTTDSSGNFSLNNLHPGIYRIYALKEKTPNKIFDNDEELIAFKKTPINLTTDTENVELRLFKQNPDKFRLTDKRFDGDGKMFFTFNKSLDSPALHVNYPPDFDKYKIVDFSKTRDTAILYMTNMAFDSLSVSFLDNNKPIDTVYLKKGKKEAFQRTLTFQYNTSSDKLKPGTDFYIRANYPIADFDASLVSLKEDSTDVSNFTLQKDSADTRRIKVIYRWRQSPTYTLTIDENAFTDVYNDKNKGARKIFSIDKPENYSQLNLTVTIPDSGKSYIVRLLNEHEYLVRSDIIHKNTTLVYKNYLAGKYRLSVVYDDNGNGKWDSGNVKHKLQPENIWVDQEIITVRPNWEQTTPISIPREPVIP
jgi:uncharacterized protein (DUF2141 family)